MLYLLVFPRFMNIGKRLPLTRAKIKRISHALLLALLTVSLSVLVPVSALGLPDTAMDVSDQEISRAQASVDQSKASLDKAKSRLEDLSKKCSTLKNEVKSMQNEIENSAEKAKNAQAAMLDGRAALSDAMLYEYKNDTISAYLEILLGSSNIDELTSNMGYISQVMDHHSSEIRAQKRLRKELSSITEELNEKLDKQEKKLKEMQEMEKEAQSLVDNLANELGAKNKKLASLKEYAEAVRKANAAAAAPEPKATQVKKGANPPQNDASKSKPVNDSNDNASDATNTDTTDNESVDGTWKTGAASAYGGSSDPYTGNPAKTATGAICNDSSMGVAIPMAWPNYKSLLGHTVVIKYNKKTVYATINDVGGMGGGARHLDLQPGVFKALGFKTCQEWGVRTVQYRIL